jgi:HTH-type transcriptional regulator, glycine betaine synthesis regulator
MSFEKSDATCFAPCNNYYEMSLSPRQARQRAIDLASETMGELIAFWGFKASMGRIWTLLYLTSEPLPADQIAERTGLSSGAVSMAISDLLVWGIIERTPAPGKRKRHYTAETDVWAMVRRIFRERELRLIKRAMQRFTEAVALLDASIEEHPDDLEARFMVSRLRGLLGLATIGYSLVEGFAEFGRLTLEPIKGALSSANRQSD